MALIANFECSPSRLVHCSRLEAPWANLEDALTGCRLPNLAAPPHNVLLGILWHLQADVFLSCSSSSSPGVTLSTGIKCGTSS